MYNFVRYILLIIAMLAIFLLYKKKLYKSIYTAVLACVVFISFLVTWFVPVENLFLRFGNSDQAFDYSFSGFKTIAVMDYSKGATILYSDKNNSLNICIIEKDSKGWKVTSPNSLSSVTIADAFGRTIRYKKMPNINLYFIGVSYYIPNNAEDKNKYVISSLSDTNMSTFKTFHFSISNYEAFYFYTYTNIIDSNYAVFINGKKQTLN